MNQIAGRASEIVQLIKYLSPKHEDLIWAP